MSNIIQLFPKKDPNLAPKSQRALNFDDRRKEIVEQLGLPMIEPAAPVVPVDPMSQVFQALHFYGSQGFDHGERARNALSHFKVVRLSNDGPKSA